MTTVRPELSKKNQYWLNKNRYYELKHFCLQYDYWKRRYSELDGLKSYSIDEKISKGKLPNDPTSKLAEERLVYLDKIRLVEQAAIGSDVELSDYILKGVTKGLSFTSLKLVDGIPCSRDTYYERYRKFFWLLDKTRN